MTVLAYTLLAAILLTEIIWKSLPRLSDYAKYIWIAAGAAWGGFLAKTEVLEEGFQWQEFAWPFFSVILFLALHEVYRKLRGRST
jgi:hypothetical protein